MALTKKVMILFDPEKYKVLELKAKIQKKSVGALVRDTMERVVILDEMESKKERVEAAKRIISSEEESVDWKEIEKLIAQGHTG